jgi:hypothetical protein
MSTSFTKYRLRSVANPRAARVDFDVVPRDFASVLKTTVLAREWQVDGMMDTGASLRVSESEGRHWFGGPAGHSGNVCPLCHKPIQLLLNLDLQAGEVNPFFAAEFAPLSRLPLFFCFRCYRGTNYRIVSDRAIQTIRPLAGDDYRPEEDTSEFIPFYHERWDEIPLAFEAQPCAVVPIPTDIHRGICDAWANRLGKMHDKREEPIPRRGELAMQWLGVDQQWDLVRSQFGGMPLRSQGYWSDRCINPECPFSYAQSRGLHPDFNVEFLLRPLAILAGDCRLEWNRESEGTVEFDVCPCCLTIHARYGCT